MPFPVALYKGKESPSGPRGCPMQPVLQSDNLSKKDVALKITPLTPPPEEEGPFLQPDYSRSGQHLNLQKIGVSNNGQLLLRGF